MGRQSIADQHPAASVLFADVVDFTPMSDRLPPSEVVGILDRLFSEFDDLVDACGLEKIKTIGDAYMVAAATPGRSWRCVIGRRRFLYDLWGDAVNTASRTESHGSPGEIQITRATYELIRDEFEAEPRGTVDV